MLIVIVTVTNTLQISLATTSPEVMDLLQWIPNSDICSRGQCNQRYNPLQLRNALMVINSSCNAFDLERFWDLESVGVSLTDDTAKDNMLKQYLTSCLTRDVDGAYIARFPWKPTHPVLPTNIAVAERSLVKRVAMTPKLLQVYNQILREQEARGFIERVDVTKDYSGTHYLPHHPVEKDSPTTPIHIVFNCSCRQGSNYPCLNDWFAMFQ